MSSTTDVLDFDVRTTLLAAAEARRTADREEANLLALAVQMVHLHAVDDETPVASRADQSLTVDEHDPMSDHVAGAGTPEVAERAVGELAAALDVAYLSGVGWSPTRWSCATGCRACGRWSRTGSCRRGRPARSLG
jgi:hypothetical protein